MPRVNQETIRREAAAADEALAAFAAAAPPAPTTLDIPPAPTEDPPADPVAPAGSSAVPAAPAPTPAPTPTPTVVPVTADTLESLQHRLATLEGMHNRAASDRDQAMRDAAELRGKIDTMTKLLAQRGPAAPTPAPTPAAPPTLITEQEKRDYGEELLGVMARRAQEVLMPMINAILRRVEKLETGQRDISATVATAAETSQRSAQQLFVDELTKLVPDWQALNENAEFLDWLKIRDMLSGQVRYELLQQAVGNGDATRVAGFFTAYKSERGMSSTPPAAPAPSASAAPATPAPAPAPAAAPFDPRTLVSPSAAAPAPPSGSPVNGKVWTSAEIADVYDRQMRHQLTPADFLSLEAQIFKALEEGRVQD